MSIVRWETLASDLASLYMVSLTDDGELTIVVVGMRGPSREHVKFVFEKFYGYRNLLEEYRTALWADNQAGAPLGWTRELLSSPWLAELREKDLLCTEDDVVEVLAAGAPEITVERP